MPEMPVVPCQRVVRVLERAGFSVGHPEVPSFVWIRCRPLSTVRGQAPRRSEQLALFGDASADRIPRRQRLSSEVQLRHRRLVGRP